MEKNIAVIWGDCSSPEIVKQTIRVLDKVAEKYGHTFHYTDAAMGGEAIDKYGDPLPQHELDKCLAADSVLLGAVGGPKWEGLPGEQRPEKGLLRLRAGMGLYSNIESDRFSELSNMFAQAGNLERALEYALRCADIEKQVAGKEHIWYGNSTIIIGNLYYALGDSINAEENYLINKNICKHTYGEYSERYVDALLSLASVNTDFSMKDGLDKATRYLDEAYSIAHKRYPLLEAQIVNQQSVIAFRNKNYEQAKTLMMQALSLCELAEGKTSNNYEILLSNTIDLYQMFGQYDEAITLGQDFLEACNQANRSDSIPAFIMVKISQANIAKGDINNALIQIEKAENIMRQYGTAKVDYINILGIMSTIYSNAGNKHRCSRFRILSSPEISRKPSALIPKFWSFMRKKDGYKR